MSADNAANIHRPNIYRLIEFAEWIISMDDPEDALAREERRTVTMTQIIARAKEALGVEK